MSDLDTTVSNGMRTVANALVGDNALGLILRQRFMTEMFELYASYTCHQNVCESPIEKAFLNALYTVAPSHGAPIEINGACWDIFAKTGQAATQGLYIFPQFEIKLQKLYRADFLVASLGWHRKETVRVLVECDGHDFHERTKEQAAKDRSRDRDLTSNGHIIFRFTGSELFRDANACAEQVLHFIKGKPKSVSAGLRQ